MRKLVGGSILAGAVVGVVALSASPAFASGWTVVNSNSDGHWTASLSPGTVVSLGDATSGQAFSCTSSTIRGVAPSGTNLPNPYARIISGSFTNCTGPLGSTGNGTVGSADINGLSYTQSTDTVGGNIPVIAIGFTFRSLLGNCTTSAAGGFNNVTYANPGGKLTIGADTPPALTITSASGSGCAGLIRTGDKVSYRATYSVIDPVPPFTVRPT